MTIQPIPPELTFSAAAAASDPPSVVARTNALLHEHQQVIWARTDRLFAYLLMFEWLGGIILASFTAPQTWSGSRSFIHPHVWASLLLGGAIVALPIFLAAVAPGRPSTRHVIAVAQMLVGAILIHLGGGRIEMHFHVFGTLAFLAFYRDWTVLVSATLVVVVDHVLRGALMPMSVFGVGSASVWRVVEHAAWVVFEDLFLIAACRRGAGEMRGIARTRAQLEHSLGGVERQVLERTEQLRGAQEELVKAARSAGMAEIATSVLHNVGNVLNSVNVSATVVTDRLKNSELASLDQVSSLLGEHRADIDQFLTADERGKMVPEFIIELSGCLRAEHEAMLGELATLARGVEHIKQIVSAQQSMAKKSTLRRSVDPRALMDAAAGMLSPGHRQGIEFVRRFDDRLAARVELDEHKVMQILVNLITNACQATVSRPGRARQVTLAIEPAPADGTADQLCFRVSDNGVGIAPENLARVFQHGFTTKKEGHGFGLHHAANAAREMGGELSVASEGADRGATFTLALPVAAAEALAAPEHDVAPEHDATSEPIVTSPGEEPAHV